jgi:D-alanyl-D-alanine dipeptidase
MRKRGAGALLALTGVCIILGVVVFARVFHTREPSPASPTQRSSAETQSSAPAEAIPSRETAETAPSVEATEPSSIESQEHADTPPPSSAAAVAATDSAVFEYDGFVDISEFDPRVIVDCRYATENNFTGTQLYPFELALLRREAAEMLARAQDAAEKDGLRIIIYDAYRPLDVQRRLYDAAPDGLKAFVARPSQTSPHGIGLTIDCGLCDMDGVELDMPSAFDTFDDSAHVNYVGGTAVQRANRDYLVELMTRCGFSVYEKEWWHFSAPNPKGYTARDFSFDEFVEARRLAAYPPIPEVLSSPEISTQRAALDAFYDRASGGVSQDGLPNSTTQLVVVDSNVASAGIYYFERAQDGIWIEREDFRVSGWVGGNGVSPDKREGDKCTPSGQFAIGEAFYIDDKPETALAAFRITADTYWVDDPASKFYNLRVEGIAEKDWESAEHMSDYSANYKYGFVIEYNSECVPGLGSAIFFHVGTRATVGCVAAGESDVIKYLSALDDGKDPYILIV